MMHRMHTMHTMHTMGMAHRDPLLACIYLLLLIAAVLYCIALCYKTYRAVFSVVILIMVAGIILLYGSFRCRHPEYKDILLRGIDVCPWCDGWSFSHFALFFLMTYLSPGSYVIFFSLGLVWEIFEYLVYTTSNSHNDTGILKYVDRLVDLSRCKSSDQLQSKNHHWIYYRWSDLVLNTLGIILGRYVSSL